MKKTEIRKECPGCISGVSNITKSIFCVLAVFIVFTSCTMQKTSVPDSAHNGFPAGTAWPHEGSDLTPDPALVKGRFDNGFRYVLMENREPENRVSMHLNVQAGSMHELDSQQGLAHYLEHILFCGSTNFQPGELIEYFQRIGMSFGGDTNAHTGFGETVYDILLPQGDEKSIDEGLMVMQDFASGAFLLQSEIDRERSVILAEKRARDSASYRIGVATREFEYTGLRLTERLPIGKEDVIEKAGHNHLKDFYDTWYRPEKMILVMVGDFDADTVIPLIKARFDTMEPRAPPRAEPVMGTLNHKGVKPFYHLEKETGSATVSIGVASTVPFERDSLDFEKRRLTKYMADAAVRNRLSDRLGKTGTPYTAAYAFSGKMYKTIEYGKIMAVCSPGSWDASLAVIEQDLRQALEYGFTAQELDRVKKEFVAMFEKELKGASTRKSEEISRIIVGELNDDRVVMSPRQEYDIYVPVIEKMTVEDLNAAFGKTWAPGHRLVAVTGNVDLEGDGPDPETAIMAVFDKSSRVPVVKPEAYSRVVFPYLPEPAGKGKIISESVYDDLGIKWIRFENGVCLNLKKTDFTADEVLALVTFGEGRSGEPQDRPGISSLSDSLINLSGLGGLKLDELERALAGKNTSVSFRTGEGMFMLNGRSVSGETDLLYQLFYAQLTDPAYRTDAYNLAGRQFRQKYEKMLRSVDGVMGINEDRFFAGGDRRFGVPSIAEYEKIGIPDVEKWVGTAFAEAPLCVSVVGDFDEKEIVELTARYFGSMPERKRKEPSSGAPQVLFPQGTSEVIDVDTSVKTAIVKVGWPTEDWTSEKRVRGLSVLGKVFSERMRKQIREKLGVSYSPYAYNWSSRSYKGYGFFQAAVNVEPDKIDLVADEVKKIASGLSEKKATEDELKRAVDPILTYLKDRVRDNGYWLYNVLSDLDRHPENIERARSLMNDYSSVTTADLADLAKAFLDNKKAAVIVVRQK